MKEVLTIILLFIGLISYAQKDYDTYFITSGSEREEFKIQLLEKKGIVDQVYIYAKSADNSYMNSVLIINSKDLNTFVEYLKFVNTKFSEWSNTAEENDVKDFSKEVEADLRDYYSVAFGIDDWYIDRRVKLRSMFTVTDRVPLVFIYSGKVYSSTNRYIDSKGIFFPFASPKDLDIFIEKLDISKMQASLSEITDTESLFK